MARRDLTIGIDGDDRGLDDALDRSKDKAEGLDRGLAKVERQQAAQEKVTERAAAAIRKYSGDMTGAALAAKRMGDEAARAADKAAKAQVRAAAAAEAAKRGILDEAKAARIAEQADEALERAALKAAAAQIAVAKAADQQAKAERELAGEAVRQEAVNARMRGGLVSLAAAGAAVAVPVGAAGLAVAGFAAVAAPSILKVVKAQQDLATNWDTLDAGQKVAASSVQGLIADYKALAKSYEPEALQVFNGAVSTTRQLLPELRRTVDATKGSIADFGTSLENTLGRETPRLFALARTQAAPALNELGTTFDETAQLAVSLVHDLAPMGLQLLGVANGGLRALNALEEINPHLVEVGATLLAVRGPASALGNLWVSGATRLGRYSKAATEAEKTTATLSKTVGSSPNIYLGAALAVGLLSYRWATAKSALDNRVDAIRAEASATKNSVAAHQKAIVALGQESVGWTTYNKAVAAGDAGLRKHASAFDQSGSVRIRKAIDAEQKAITNITQGEDLLGKQYGITATQADALATAAGVDLSKGITGSGAAAKQAQLKIKQYAESAKAASDTTFIVGKSLDAAGNKALDLKTRVTALDTAFGALAGPELQAYDATTKTAGAFAQMNEALKKSKGSLSVNTSAGLAARSAFSSLLNTVQESTKSQYQYESVTLGVVKAKANLADRARAMLPLLLAETHGSKAAANAVLDWANSQGVGKTRAEALNVILGVGKKAFLAAAKSAGLGTKAANDLWAALNKLPQVKNTKINNNAKEKRKEVEDYQAKLDALHGKNVHIGDNAADAQARVNRVQQAINALHNRTVTITTRKIIETLEIAHRTSQAERARADGGIDRYAAGGMRHDLPPHIVTRPTVLYGEPETGGEAYIPLGEAKRTRSKELLSDVARIFGLSVVRPMADGGILKFADGGATVSLSDVLSQWQTVVQPASSSDVTAAKKTRATQKDQLANANAALRRAERESTKTHRDRVKRAEDIAAAERRVKKERSDLADATKKLTDVEKRYQAGRQSPAAQLGSALALNIKNTGAFISNLSTLTDRGFGVLAQHLLAQGDATAEKIAADAVKMSTSKLSGLQKQVQQADQQQTTLAGLGSILTIKTAMKGGSNTWDSLLTATGLAPNDLAATLKLMSADLAKTAAGQALLAMMKAHGYARGGEITGTPGVDNVPLWGTAGEFMVNRQATGRNKDLLNAINTGRPLQLPAGMVRGGDGASAGRPVVINVYARDSQSALATAKATAHELGWELKKGGTQ
jgi:hypothetical protein